MFFFEKKNQKTLELGVCGGAARRLGDKSFLLLFCKREALPYSCRNGE
jgi:hypothetical protein